MILGLKKMLNEETKLDILSEAAKQVTTDVKDLFLDDPETALIGAEEDPEIAQLVNTIPEYDDHDEETEREIEKLTENLSVVN